MADLYSLNNRAELAGGNPLDGWVYTSHYKIFVAYASADPADTTEQNNVGHSFQRAIAPNWSVVGTQVGTPISMVVDANRWGDAAIIKQVMDEQVFRSTVGDTTWTVQEADGAWKDGDQVGNTWVAAARRYKTNALTWFTEARFPVSANDDLVNDTENKFRPFDIVIHSEVTYDASNLEYMNAIETGMTFNLGNHFDSTGRTIDYPGDLAISPDRLYLLSVEGDDFAETDIDQTTDVFYDINGDFEKIISELNPLAYTWTKDDNTGAGVSSSEELLMFLDARVVDPINVANRINSIGSWASDGGTNDIYFWMSAPDMKWTG